MAAAESIAEACLNLRLPEEGRALSELRLHLDWHRSGSESFSFVFDVFSGDASQRCIIKAYTPYYSGDDLTAGFDRLLARRKLIQEAGGRVPRLYAAHRCTVLERFIRFDLDVAMRVLDRPARERIRTDVLAIASALDALRFKPINGWLKGLRADDSGAFIIDFGSDLGGPGVGDSGSWCRDQAQSYLLGYPNEP